jgi:peptidoglycan/xylan/chitin deacetylase (PgdA/CDA1 family)
MVMAGAPAFDLPILMYHHLERGVPTGEFSLAVDDFKRQLDWLAARAFTTLTFRQLFEICDGVRPSPARPLIITFDDGYESFRELAVPALVERRMSATLFVVAGEIGEYNRWDTGRAPHRRLMNAAAIESVVDAGIELGGHGWRHRDLTLCSDGDAYDEIAATRQLLAERFAAPVDVFAYPYGRYRPAQRALVERAGYRGAVSIFSPSATVTGDRYAMRRIYVHSGDGWLRFTAKLTAPYLRYAAWRDGRGAAGVHVPGHECPAHG